MAVDRQLLLRERFGLASFHPWQREAIEALLDDGRRVLVIAPTGGGKSLCYQLPAVELPGTTVVVSPLIALMEDQVRGLAERGIRATWLSSTVPDGERARRRDALMQNQYDLVYVAPERLTKGGLTTLLARIRPPLVAIDEAHCISQWGHDFRPDYTKLRGVLDTLRPPRVMACTATATPRVREEILRELGMEPAETRVVLRGFARPNLHLAVRPIDRWGVRKEAACIALAAALGAPAAPQGGAIIYASTRKKTEEVTATVASKGWRAATYHAGLANGVRAEVNSRFARGELDVVVATNAFGMGIDRADIRAVVHVQAPGSIEAYYQEVGRAGRDGQPAVGLLVSGMNDFGLRRRLIELNTKSKSRIDQQWKLFLDLMKYVEAGSCRHDFILRYFDDEQELLGGCGHCDVCERLEETGESADRPLGPEDEIVVRKALSGIARNRRRAGIVRVAEMLEGKRTKKLASLGLDRLSTFGLLSQHSHEWVVSLLRRLVTAGLVEVTSTDFPVPFLSPAGVAVMKGDVAPRLILPDERAVVPNRPRSRAGRASRELPAGPARELFEKLRAERLAIAEEKGVPAYVICHDRTLQEIATRSPQTLHELAEVHGMGPARLSSFGDRLLGVVLGA